MRKVLEQTSHGRDAYVNIDAVRNTLGKPSQFPDAWRAVQHIENHDVVRWDHENHRPRAPRVPSLADPSNSRSWYARSRSRVATALLLTAPGIPMLFMGQEFLEDKPWHDDVDFWSQFLIWWDGLLTEEPHMQDFHRFMTELIWLRRNQPALRGEGLRVPQTHEVDRVIVVHRWEGGASQDVVIVASFNESVLESYPVDLPSPGRWVEIFNSDFYDHYPNQSVVGNGGSVDANGPPGHTYAQTARMRIPANGVIVLARDA